MALIYPVLKIKVGRVSLVAIVKEDDQGKCIEIGYAVFCGNTFVGQFADLTDALKCFKAEVKRIYPSRAERPRIVFIDASGKEHPCESLAEAKQCLLQELTLLNLSNLPVLKASKHEITRAYLGPNFGASFDPAIPEDSPPQP